jgi:hypothetical protein
MKLYRLESFVVAAFAASLLLALMACGGGGDGSTPGDLNSPIAIRFNPTTAQENVTRSGNLYTMLVTARLSHAPSGPAYAYVIADAPVLTPGATVVTRNADGSYTASLPVAASLPSGVHTGNLTLELCKDAACTQPYALTGATLPYVITVQ